MQWKCFHNLVAISEYWDHESEFCDENLIFGKNGVEFEALMANSTMNVSFAADRARLHTNSSVGAWPPSTEKNQWPPASAGTGVSGPFGRLGLDHLDTAGSGTERGLGAGGG